MNLSPNWTYVADTVMGGVSDGQLSHGTVAGRDAARLTGSVSTENNGGFIQMAADLGPEGDVLDASDWTGISVDVLGNGEAYDLRLRTDALTRPWQSFRAEFRARAEWTVVSLPFTDFEAHNTQAHFDPARVRRVGILAVGRAFTADVAIAGLRLYR
ncbi:MAG: CIA30 family protein [Pseudomonadota bacterium]